MEIKTEKLTVADLEHIAEYLIKNQDEIETVIDAFGKKLSDNGHGTYFLQPNNTLFKTFWISQDSGKIQSAGFGGVNLGLTLKDLISVYSHYNKGFVPYDDEYVYVFFKSEYHRHRIKITSKDTIIVNSEMVKDIAVNSLEIAIG